MSAPCGVCGVGTDRILTVTTDRSSVWRSACDAHVDLVRSLMLKLAAEKVRQERTNAEHARKLAAIDADHQRRMREIEAGRLAGELAHKKEMARIRAIGRQAFVAAAVMGLGVALLGVPGLPSFWPMFVVGVGIGRTIALMKQL